MIKNYFIDVHLADFFLLSFYFISFISILYFIIIGFKEVNKTSRIIFLSYFFLYNIILLIDVKFNFLPFLPDSTQFYTLFRTGRSFEGMSSSLNGFLFLIQFIRILFLENLLVYLSFQVFIYFISILIILKAWLLIYPFTIKNSFIQLFFILSLSLPSSILYHLVPLRECFSTLGFTIAIYSLTIAFKKSQTVNFGYLASIIFIIQIRMQIAFYFIVSLVGVKLSFDKNILRKLTVVFLGIILFLGVLSLTKYKIDPVGLGKTRNYRVEKYSGSYGLVEWKNHYDIVKSTPFLVSQFLFSPLPILHNNNPLNMRLIFIDALIVLFLWGVILSDFFSVVKQFKYWFILITIYLLLFGIYEFNIGGAVRHRLPLSIMTILITSHILSKKINNLVQKLKIEKN